MKHILTIMKKEFARFFKDRRMVFSVLILPGLLIFILYSILGSSISKQITQENNKTAIVYLIDESSMIRSKMEEIPNLELKSEINDPKKLDALFDQLENKKIDIIMEFSPNFDENIGQEELPEISIYYNSSNSISMSAYTTINTLLDSLQHQSLFHTNLHSDIQYDVASNEEVMGSIFGMILPFLIIALMFSSCISVAPESIAGEKERGTMATLLVTPIKRSEIAIGKVLSLSIIAVLCALSSFLGTIAALPSMMNQMMVDTATTMEIEISYQLKDYLLLLFIIISTLLVLIGIISIISSYARSVKEATTLIAPFMILIMVVGIFSMFTEQNESHHVALYFIPIFNSLIAMRDVFTFNIHVLPILITILSNFVYASIIIYLVTLMFKSEKVMFGR